jgi:hypothetical protein
LVVRPASRLTEILNGKRGISPDTALRLSRCLGPSAAFWLELAEPDLARIDRLFRPELTTSFRAAGQDYLRMNLQSSGLACNDAAPTRIICN